MGFYRWEAKQTGVTVIVNAPFFIQMLRLKLNPPLGFILKQSKKLILGNQVCSDNMNL